VLSSSHLKLLCRTCRMDYISSALPLGAFCGLHTVVIKKSLLPVV